MNEFVSPVKIVPHPAQNVYDKLADWNNLSQVAPLLPSDKVEEFSFDADSCRFKVNAMGVGRIALRIIDREPFKTIKIASEESPISFTMWIQIKEKDSESCYIKLTLRADIPFMLKGMVSKPLQEGMEKIADVLSRLPY
ncbi:MAG: SRPBCC family protein [Bacteroidales bacterium]|nr:SRPBCC family protein [Bacteroidales bacterium]